VFDSYATGDQSSAKVTVVNQTQTDQRNLRVRVRFYDLQGNVRADQSADNVFVSSGGALQVMTLPRGPADSSVFFVRCQLIDGSGKPITDNVYWQSQWPDDVGSPQNDVAFDSVQASWADMTALNYMSPAPLDVTARHSSNEGDNGVVIRLHNWTSRVAFFERAEILSTSDGDEILPIQYDDNYVTVFPGETVEIRGVVPPNGPGASWVRVAGYNTSPVTVPIK
ncbi:MAG TPA: glycoside hydrolase, partial [Mycobacterium sp.]|nr:glycoside hydrolase [Mycobacterium sp.]